jgi:hypothetical protein
VEELLPKDNENVPLTLDEIPSDPGPQPFAPDQMIRCDECLRANPPTRVSCLYCAAALPLSETTINLQKPALRRLEKWEQGYNNILLPPLANLAENAVVEAADVLRLTTADLERILSVGLPMPLARASNADEAALVQRRVDHLQIKTLIVPDAELGGDQAGPTRVRTIDIDDAGIHAYQTPDTPAKRIAWSDFVLLVTGRLIVKRVELKEQKDAHSENRILDASEFFSDESVVDLYTLQQNMPYRITANSFDFSCLGKKKSLVASENILVLVNLFRVHAPHVKYDDSYNLVRKALEAVWPSEQQNESLGWRRERPGKYSIGSATEIGNEMQFLRYSRLRNFFQSETFRASPRSEQD